ncbi:MAG: IS200/IS605 family element transposase accessory protein TnpB [Candidatus Helarchaeota archaeon]|nr:IS200/IS605 family element transposase accessory protein TnpB [Candidatus Helarchaeota archaeon]
MKTFKTVRLTSFQLTKRKYEKIARAIACFKDSINFLIAKCIDNPLFRKVSKKGNTYYNYSSYPTIRKSFYFEWKAKFPYLHTHYCHSAARITKDILRSWNSWCFKKKRRLPNPNYKKTSMKLEECLCYLEGHYVVLVIEPRSKLYIPFQPTRHFNELRTENHGEITLKLNPDRTVGIFIPFIQEVQPREIASLLFIDTNERSVDFLLVNETSAQVRSLDTTQLSTTHFTYSLKRRNISQKIAQDSKHQPQKRKKLLDKYGKRERNKTTNMMHAVTNEIARTVETNRALVVLEDLTNIRQSLARQKNLKPRHQKKSKKMRRRLNRWNFRQFQIYLEYKVKATGHPVKHINPRYTSQKCLQCGKRTKCWGKIFTCKHCGFTIDRHILATLNIAEVFLSTQDVARPDPAERSRMTMMARAVRNCKDTIIREASHRDEIIGIHPVLST